MPVIWNPRLKRSAIQRTDGFATKRVMVQTETGYYPAWEDELRLFGCDFWHPTISQRSQPGWPDYVVLGEGWHAFVELKARSLATNRRGKVSAAQYRYRDSIEAAGGEWKTFTLPDDWADVDDWLNEKTGKGLVVSR